MKTGANTLIKTKSKRQVGLLRNDGVKSYIIRKVKGIKLLRKS